MKVKIIVLLSVLISFSSCVKDENRVKGTVTYKDALTGDIFKADYAKIEIRKARMNIVYKTIYADADGKYNYYPLEDGDYNIVAYYDDVLFSYTCSPFYFSVKKDMIKIIDLQLE